MGRQKQALPSNDIEAIVKCDLNSSMIKRVKGALTLTCRVSALHLASCDEDLTYKGDSEFGWGLGHCGHDAPFFALFQSFPLAKFKAAQPP